LLDTAALMLGSPGASGSGGLGSGRGGGEGMLRVATLRKNTVMVSRNYSHHQFSSPSAGGGRERSGTMLRSAPPITLHEDDEDGLGSANNAAAAAAAPQVDEDEEESHLSRLNALRENRRGGGRGRMRPLMDLFTELQTAPSAITVQHTALNTAPPRKAGVNAKDTRIRRKHPSARDPAVVFKNLSTGEYDNLGALLPTNLDDDGLYGTGADGGGNGVGGEDSGSGSAGSGDDLAGDL
jgi:hypothetical protein